MRGLPQQRSTRIKQIVSVLGMPANTLMVTKGHNERRNVTPQLIVPNHQETDLDLLMHTNMILHPADLHVPELGVDEINTEMMMTLEEAWIILLTLVPTKTAKERSREFLSSLPSSKIGHLMTRSTRQATIWMTTGAPETSAYVTREGLLPAPRRVMMSMRGRKGTAGEVEVRGGG